MLFRTSLAVLAITAATPALADAVTYKGSLGPVDIVVELSIGIEEATETLFGRYNYPRNGIDLPLNAISVEPGHVVLSEEIPCSDAICEPAMESGIAPEALRGPVWELTSTDGGQTLTGTWESDPGETPLEVKLERVGSRPFDLIDPARPEYLAGLSYEFYEGGKVLTQENAPYEYLKSQAKMTASEETRRDDVAFRYLTDPRSKFPFPEITDLGGIDPSAANRRLASRQAVMTISALECEARQYFGMGWMPGAENWLGSLAGYPDEQVQVTYLSPTVMSWSESGMLFCGGAYPEVHTYLTTIDTRTGKDLDLSKIFADSKMGDYRWEPGQSLIDLAIARRDKSEYAFGEDCGIDELIATNLDVTFKEGDIAVFTLQGLPHVIQACQDDIFEAPLAELKDHLAPTAAEYFPSLGR